MAGYVNVEDVYARTVLDACGRPGIEIKLMTETKMTETTTFSAVKCLYEETEGNEKENQWRYMRRRAEEAADIVNSFWAPLLVGSNIMDQELFDHALIVALGRKSEIKRHINLSMQLSLTAARCAAKVLGLPFYKYVGGIHSGNLPVPLMDLFEISGICEEKSQKCKIMLIFCESNFLFEKITAYAEILEQLRKIFIQKKYQFCRSENGHVVFEIAEAEKIISVIKETVKKINYEFGSDIQIAAAGIPMKSEKLKNFLDEFSLCYIELQKDESKERNEWRECLKSRELIPGKISQAKAARQEDMMIVDVFREKTFTQLSEKVCFMKKCGHKLVMDSEGAEEADVFDADLAAGFHTDYIKIGVPWNYGSAMKINRLLEIEEHIG